MPPSQLPPYPPSPGASPAYGVAPPQGKPKSGLLRNAGCAVGLGCLALIVLVGVVSAGLFTVVLASLRASDVYAVAMHAATTDPALNAELGSPIQAGWLVTGSIHVAAGVGDASIAIPISGPRGTGEITAVAKKAAGAWTFSALNARVNGRPTAIDLLPSLPP